MILLWLPNSYVYVLALHDTMYRYYIDIEGYLKEDYSEPWIEEDIEL